MCKINIEILEALAQITSSSVKELSFFAKTENEEICLIKTNFLKHFAEDVFFLNDHSNDKNFSYRFGDLIIRDMLEQLIEFLYLIKNPYRAKEYLGLTINTSNLNKEQSFVEKTKLFGEKRYNKYTKRKHGRPSVSKMAENIGEKISTTDGLTLYDLYQFFPINAITHIFLLY